jgi:transposase
LELLKAENISHKIIAALGAAGVLLIRVPKWSGLKGWGAKLTKRNGLRKAKIAVAWIALILHRMSIDGIEFNWSTRKAAA